MGIDLALLPDPSSSMSLQLAVPGRVVLKQSSPLI